MIRQKDGYSQLIVCNDFKKFNYFIILIIYIGTMIKKLLDRLMVYTTLVWNNVTLFNNKFYY